jgi:prepilin-type N-terminal cleavage/methylation domain-containing protein
MASSSLHAGLRHRLIQQLAAKRSQSQSALNKGFTLIELLVVVIIIGILASVALPGFLSQSDKAKASSAKAMVGGALKECQVWLVEATGAYAQQATGTPEITLAGNTCTAAAGGTWTATIVSSGDTFTATLPSANGTVTKTCTGTVGCNGGTW